MDGISSPVSFLPSNVHFLRMELGLTRDKLAECIGSTSQAIAAIENQRSENSGWRTIVALAKFFGLSVEELTETDARNLISVRHTFRRAEQILGSKRYDEIYFIIDAINKEIMKEAERGRFRRSSRAGPLKV